MAKAAGHYTALRSQVQGPCSIKGIPGLSLPLLSSKEPLKVDFCHHPSSSWPLILGLQAPFQLFVILVIYVKILIVELKYFVFPLHTKKWYLFLGSYKMAVSTLLSSSSQDSGVHKTLREFSATSHRRAFSGWRTWLFLHFVSSILCTFNL